MVARDVTIELRRQARSTLVAQARRSERRERGGILVGYRTGDIIVVEDALPVADAHATRVGYTRYRQAGQAALDSWLEHVEDPALGYVGEWHTHPGPVPPSSIDRASARALGLRATQPVAVLVAALDPADRTVAVHGLAAGGGSVFARVVRPSRTASVLLAPNEGSGREST